MHARVSFTAASNMLVHMLCLCVSRYAVTGLSVHPTGGLALSVGKDRTVRYCDEFWKVFCWVMILLFVFRTWNLSTGLAAFTLRLPKGV